MRKIALLVVIIYALAVMFIAATAHAQDTISIEPYYEVPVPCNKYIDEIEKYPWNVTIVTKIMWLESKCRNAAVGDGHLIFDKGAHGMSCGLMQVRILPKRNITCEEMKDPAKNIKKAYEIYKDQGFKAWTAYKNI